MTRSCVEYSLFNILSDYLLPRQVETIINYPNPGESRLKNRNRKLIKSPVPNRTRLYPLHKLILNNLISLHTTLYLPQNVAHQIIARFIQPPNADALMHLALNTLSYTPYLFQHTNKLRAMTTL